MEIQTTHPPRMAWIIGGSLGAVLIVLVVAGGVVLGFNLMQQESEDTVASNTAAELRQAPVVVPPAVAQVSAPARPPSALQPDLELARREHASGQSIGARQRLETLIRRGESMGIAPGQSDASVMASAHLLLGELLVGTMARPSPPRGPEDFGRISSAVTTPYAQINQHCLRAVHYDPAQNGQASFCHGHLSERAGDLYAEMARTPAYTEPLAPQMITFLGQAARRHLMNAERSYGLVSTAPDNSGVHERAAQALQRVRTSLSGLSNVP